MRNVHLQCITKMNLVSKFKVISVLIDSCTYNLVYNSVDSTGVQEQGGRSVVRSYEVANNYANERLIMAQLMIIMQELVIMR